MANHEHLKLLRQRVEAWNMWRVGNEDERPDLSSAILVGADLVGADLSGADLSGAILTRADLTRAGLTRADLTRAGLTRAKLCEAILCEAILREADLTGCVLWQTIFGNVDLSEIKGLETVRHKGPSSIGIDTLFRSKGKIPEGFLRGAGVPDIYIQYAASLVGAAFEFYSVFISYSCKDEELAMRLHADLQAKGARCWFAPEDLKIGDKFRVEIDHAIRFLLTHPQCRALEKLPALSVEARIELLRELLRGRKLEPEYQQRFEDDTASCLAVERLRGQILQRYLLHPESVWLYELVALDDWINHVWIELDNSMGGHAGYLMMHERRNAD